MKWSWPRGTAAQYCVKVSVAALAGYLLSVGGPLYATYGAFSAALVVGASRGEDTHGAANRVRGTIAGMLLGVAVTLFPVPPALALVVGIAATAYMCMGFGWGLPAARIGVALVVVTVLLHLTDVLGYGGKRIANTVIGVAAGLLVSYTVLPVRGRDAMARAAERALMAVSQLLETVGRPDRAPENSQYRAVIDGLIELQKALTDARREVGGEAETLRHIAREAALACVGSLTAAVALEELRGSPASLVAAVPLCRRAAVLATRARAGGQSGTAQDSVPLVAPSDAGLPASSDEMAHQGLALALRQIDRALEALGR